MQEIHYVIAPGFEFFSLCVSVRVQATKPCTVSFGGPMMGHLSEFIRPASLRLQARGRGEPGARVYIKQLLRVLRWSKEVDLIFSCIVTAHFLSLMDHTISKRVFFVRSAALQVFCQYIYIYNNHATSTYTDPFGRADDIRHDRVSEVSMPFHIKPTYTEPTNASFHIWVRKELCQLWTQPIETDSETTAPCEWRSANR